MMQAHARQSAGFTMVEMMIAIALLAIIMALAVPSFRDATMGSQLRSVANELVAGAALARSEAIKRNAVVTLCASSDGSNCTGSWHQGWLVHQGGTILSVKRDLPSGLRITPAGGQTALNFQPIGAGSTSASLKICRDTPTAGRQERIVDIDLTGRASVSRTTDGTCP